MKTNIGLSLNMIHQCDVLEGLRKIADNSIDCIITSPPYNLAGLKGKKAKSRKIWNDIIKYDNYDDDRTEEDYKKWQIEILNECYRILKPNGSAFFNYKVRLYNNTCSFPLEWILKSKFNVRQEIVWDRLGSVSLNPSKFLPVTERIYWLTKGNGNVRFKRMEGITDVWSFKADTKNSHPAPFPVDLPNKILPNILGDKKMRAELGDRLIVLDPFMGSGTTAVSAVKHGCDWIGFDISPNYIEMAMERIESCK